MADKTLKIGATFLVGFTVAIVILAFASNQGIVSFNDVPLQMLGVEDTRGGPVSGTGEGSEITKQLRKRYEGCDNKPIMCGNDHSWDKLSVDAAQQLFDRKMNHYAYVCKNSKRFGNTGPGMKAYGGYELCLDHPFASQNGSCLAYSFGINNEWSFDEDVNKRLGCVVHSFDPSMNKPDHMHKPNIYFHDLGIWGMDMTNEQGWKLKRFSTIKKLLGHQNKIIDVVKLDVESAEWPALRDMIQTGDFDQIKQIILEIHTPKWLKLHKPMTIQEYAELYNYFTSLEMLGFKIHRMHNELSCCARFHFLISPKNRLGRGGGLCCYEITLVNTKFIQT